MAPPIAVVTRTPVAVAVSQPLSCAGLAPARFRVTVTAVVPPAGTVTVAAFKVTAAGDCSDSVTEAVPALRYSTVRVTLSAVSFSTCRPKSATGVAVTCWVVARVRSTRPAPWSYTVAFALVAAVLTSVSLIRCPDQSGCCCARIAAAPATCGVAIEVPFAAV
jgi:hypothetical protein